jgi:hypothetical protein
MPAIAAANVTVTVTKETRTARQRMNVIKIVFGDGALTYPSGGVPLPTTVSSFGLRLVIDSLNLTDGDDASGILWKYDKENHKLRGYIQGIVVSAAGAATMDDFALDTTADPLATAVAVSLTNSTGAGTKYMGKLIELTTTHAPAAQTLYGEVMGR